MTEEVQVLAEADSAPEQAATAAPESAVQSPEVADDQQTASSKTFTQEELDAAIGKRLAREQRKWEREQQAKLAETQVRQAVPKDLPSVDQFESPEAYADALAYKKAEELLNQRERQKQQVELRNAYADREEQARDKYDDFEQVAYNPNLPITDVMAQTIQASDVGPDVAYYLGLIQRKQLEFLFCRHICKPRKLEGLKPNWLIILPLNELPPRLRLSHLLTPEEATATRLLTRLTRVLSRT